MYIYIYIHIYISYSLIFFIMNLFHLVCKCEPCSLLVHYLNSELVLELHIIENEQWYESIYDILFDILIYIYISSIDPILLSYFETTTYSPTTYTHTNNTTLSLTFHLYLLLYYIHTTYPPYTTTHHQSPNITHTIWPNQHIPNYPTYIYILQQTNKPL